MLKKMRIRKHEVGLWLRYGDFKQLLGPGAYWLPSTTVFAPKEDYQALIPEAELDGYLRDIGVEEAGQLVAT